jgi:2-C-methyl-D-erythritol 4-phosphate cytidylyltransferase
LAEKEYAIIVAGGKGTRIGGSTPKQFLALAGKPILVHTIEAFLTYSRQIEIILVLPDNEIKTWQVIAEKHGVLNGVQIVNGGETRFRSVRNGLQKINDGLVAIHDGVRPLVSSEVIKNGFELAGRHGAAIACVGLKDSIRLVYPGSSKSVDRSSFRLIQTPQVFSTSLIKAAYGSVDEKGITDDASVAERAGHSIHLYDGSYENIKITTSEDLVIAEAFLKTKAGL